MHDEAQEGDARLYWADDTPHVAFHHGNHAGNWSHHTRAKLNGASCGYKAVAGEIEDAEAEAFEIRVQEAAQVKRWLSKFSPLHMTEL